ncbi:MAG: ISNCY family transposase, partial [Fusobacteriaceae bacterium]
SIRNISRLIKGYSTFGKGFFVHVNRYYKTSTTLSLKAQDNILSLFKDKYFDFNFKHFYEKITKYEGVLCIVC